MSDAPAPPAESQPADRSPRARLRRLWQQWIKPAVYVVLILGSFRTVVADWNDVPSGSMEPTIEPGDRIVVNKLAYQVHVPLLGWHLWEYGGPQRGDIVVCYSPANGVRLVKRVVAVPGDRIALRDNVLVIDGRPAQYQWDEAGAGNDGTETLAGRTHLLQRSPSIAAERDFAERVVPAGQYFVMGDNRDRSADSRSFGFVPRSQVVGRAFAVAFSLDPAHHRLPRWERFCKGLP